ncbi:MAG: membrane bound O-acyl transferase family-domain-containing protein [Acidobacteriota bacterium]
MSAYTPTPGVAAALVAALAVVLALGLAIDRLSPHRRLARILAWTLVVAAIVFSERITSAEPAGVRMLAVIGMLLYSMKALVSIESEKRLGALRWLAFAALWPGMRPGLFARAGGPRRDGAWKLVRAGTVRLAIGIALIAASRAVWLLTGSRVAATVSMLPGLSLVLHFGLFNLAAGGWRLLGVDASPLFKAPMLSTSLAEFWGRRWNLAFSEMTATGIYRPLSGVAGKPTALVAAFIASGLFHELAISVPVKRGFGLPLLYFAIHAALMSIERALEARGKPIGRRAWIGRTWTIFWLVVPMPILFHPPFLAGAIWPLVGIR